jgi:hypothetical protein
VTGLTLATRNVGALQRAGVELVDPFARSAEPFHTPTRTD